MPEGRNNPPFVAYYTGTPGITTTTPFVALYVGDNPFVTAYGTAGGAATLTIYYSGDGSTWYAGQSKQVLAGSGPFGIDATTGAAYIGLGTTASVAITAYLSAKG